MATCFACSAAVSAAAHFCIRCGAQIAPRTPSVLVQVPKALPVRRVSLLPAIAPTITRVAAAAMLPALVGLLAREVVRLVMDRSDRRLFRMRGSLTRQSNGQSERLTFDADVLAPRRRWWLI